MFYNRETIRGIKISQLVENPQLYHDWLRSLNDEKGLLFEFECLKFFVPKKGYLLNYTISSGICFSSVKSFFFVSFFMRLTTLLLVVDGAISST